MIFRAIIILFFSVSVQAESLGAFSLDPLSTPVRLIELKRFSTIGEAASYYGQKVGYTLKLRHPAPADASFIASLPIKPSMLREEVVPFKRMLVRLIGENNILIVDPNKKHFTFGPELEKDWVPVESINDIFIGKYYID